MRHVSVRLPEEMIRCLRQQAISEGTTVSQLIRLAVRHYCERAALPAAWQRYHARPVPVQGRGNPAPTKGKEEPMTVTIDIKTIYGEATARLADLPAYEAAALEQAGKGQDVVITGPGPVWLYLRVAHVLHGVARSLTYDSPATGPVAIFNHNPF